MARMSILCQSNVRDAVEWGRVRSSEVKMSSGLVDRGWDFPNIRNQSKASQRRLSSPCYLRRPVPKLSWETFWALSRVGEAVFGAGVRTGA